MEEQRHWGPEGLSWQGPWHARRCCSAVTGGPSLAGRVQDRWRGSWAGVDVPRSWQERQRRSRQTRQERIPGAPGSGCRLKPGQVREGHWSRGEQARNWAQAVSEPGPTAA